MWLWRVVVGVICVWVALSAGQAQQIPSQPPSSATASPSFDVATIKPLDKGGRAMVGFYSFPGGKVMVDGPAIMIVQIAYGVQPFQIVGAPQWAHDFYTVTALLPENSPSRNAVQTGTRIYPTDEQKLMLQNLLADRLGLKIHREVSDGPVFFLERSGKPLRLDPPKHPEMEARGSIVMKSDVGLTGEAFGQNISMEKFAESLSRTLQTLVIDHTGITGNYDFHVAGTDSNQDATDATISALEQLGLKLKAGKGPVEKIVIDSVSKPTEN